jgi:hypothetical protein
MRAASPAVGQFGLSWDPPDSGLNRLSIRVGFPWISLDSFVRIGTFQWVTGGVAREIFSCCFSPQRLPNQCVKSSWQPALFDKGAMCRSATFHEFSVAGILIFRKRLMKNTGRGNSAQRKAA